MLFAVGLVSSPPLLVPELAGAAAAETDQLRSGSLEVATRLGTSTARWIAVGTGPRTAVVPSSARGTYLGFGTGVEVALAPGSGGEADPAMPLSALTAGWLRSAGAPSVTVEARTYVATATPDECVQWGRALRTELDAADEPVALLVVADGATTLTDKAPGALNPAAPAAQSALDQALATADVRALDALDPAQCAEWGIDGRVPWQVLAAAIGSTTVTATTFYVGAPYGVGYFCGLWEL